MAIGGFGMVILLSRAGFEADSLEDFKGLNARSPWFAAVMLMLMFSMAGVPPFVGFWAKLAVIQAVLHIGSVWLAIVAVLFSVIGAYYYLRVVKLMYFDEPTDRAALQGSGSMRFVLSVNGLAVLVLGLFPGLLLALVRAGHSLSYRRRRDRSLCLKCLLKADLSIIGGSIAGWSSLAARRAHNPKVVGSNPTPATTFSATVPVAIATGARPNSAMTCRPCSAGRNTIESVSNA